MRLLRSIAASCALAGVAFGGPAGAQSDAGKLPTIVDAGAIDWRNPLGMGVAIATLHGDPSKPGLFVQRVKFPPNTFDKPHFHNGDRHIVVIKGTFWVGTGTDWNPDKAMPVKAGGYLFQPARSVHWDGAKDEEVIVQVMGNGPGGSTLVDKAEPFLVRSPR